MTKSITLLLVALVCLSSAAFFPTSWRSRMTRYGGNFEFKNFIFLTNNSNFCYLCLAAMARCSYFNTSQTDFNAYFHLKPLLMPFADNSRKLVFFTLAKEQIRFQLTQFSRAADDPAEFNGYRFG